MIMISYSELPDIIPIHFNGAGLADRFGEKGNILILPLIATAIFTILTILNRFPNLFNYPITITKDNAFRQYLNATRMIRYLKLMIVAVFGFITIQTIRSAKGETEGLGIWFLPVMLTLFFIPLAYFISQSFRINKRPEEDVK